MLKIAIKCDLSENSGYGHFKRMYGLSKELEKLNFKCFFLFSIYQKKIIDKIKNKPNIYYFDNKKLLFDKEIFYFFKKKNINILILDTYKKSLSMEKKIKSIKNLVFIKINDQNLSSIADIIITNKEIEELKISEKKDQIILSGFNHALSFYNQKKIINKKRHNLKKFKILFHAGGSDNYLKIKNFLKYTLLALSKKKGVDLEILIIKNKTKKFIQNLAAKLKIKKKPKIINYINNLPQKLKNYDIVSGPLGTTTFETILAGSLPLTIEPLSNIKFSSYSWLKNGHLLNLNNSEKNNSKIIFEIWNLIFKNYNLIKQNLAIHSKNLDGKGNKRVAFKIKKYLEKNLTEEKRQEIKQTFRSCKPEDAREFLRIRNQLENRKVGTKPRHLISWPEHIEWWLNNKIYKYGFIINNKPIAFHWIRLIKNKYGRYLVSGWVVDKNAKNKLNISLKILKHQTQIVKQKFSKISWIIILKKNNKFVYKINQKMGFKKATKISEKSASNYFKIRLKNYFVMEMKK